MPHPADHRCDIGEIDYSSVATGYLRCRIDRGGCGREWRFVTGRGWMASPRPIGSGR